MNHPDTLRAVAALDDAGKDTEALRQFPLTTAPAGVAAAEITLRDHFAGQALVGRRLSQRPRAKAHHLVREHAAPITLPRVSCLESEG